MSLVSAVSMNKAAFAANTVLLWLQVQDIDIEGLQKLLQQQPGRVLLLDVRTPDEQAVSVIDGPVVLKSDFEKNREHYRDAQLVSYWSAMYQTSTAALSSSSGLLAGQAVPLCCSTVGARSGKYAKMLHSEGFKVLNLKGSIVAWVGPACCAAVQIALPYCRQWQ